MLKLPKEIEVRGLEGWASFMLETLGKMEIFDSSLKLIGKFSPHQKFAKKRNRQEKNFAFSSCFAQKGEAGSERRQRKIAEGWLKSEHQDCCAGGEKIRLLCPTEAFNYLD